MSAIRGQARLLPSIASLTDAAMLSHTLGCAVADVCVEPLAGVGYSNASLERVTVTIADGATRSFVLKRTDLNTDWTARLTGDRRGREAQLLSEPSLAAVWEVFACPYVAYAVGDNAVGLLMVDLTPSLLPDVRMPLSDAEEQRLLYSLARLHATFWDATVVSHAWLVRPEQYCDVLAPATADDPHALAALSPSLRDGVPRGWTSARARLPKEVTASMERAGAEWAHLWRDLPHTLLHGDAKVANFALLPGDAVAAFDWAIAGAGPCTIDVGWYLAVNASRLTASKEDVLARYRQLLQAALGCSLSDALWARLEAFAILTGARMLLWSKALGVDAGRTGAAEEWDWWVRRLAAISRTAYT